MNKILSVIFYTIILVWNGISFASSDCNLDVLRQSISFSNISFTDDGGDITIKLDGTNAVFVQENYFTVPTKIEQFIFPFGTTIQNVSCVPQTVYQQILSKKLVGIQNSICKNKNEFHNFIYNPKEIRSFNDWFTYSVGTGLMGTKRCIFVEVELFPIQYFPDENTIQWTDEIDICIKVSQGNTQMKFEEEYKLIVISHPDFHEELQGLIAHKWERSLSSKLVILDDIYDGTYFPVKGRDDIEQIKFFIKDAIEHWNTTYVLLVGGVRHLPARLTNIYFEHIYQDEWIFLSDLYYSDIYDKEYEFCSWDSNENSIFAEMAWEGNFDELDLYPDVHLGRLACVNKSEVRICVEKIIAYETNESYAETWFTNLVLIGGDSSPFDEENIDEGEYIQDIIIRSMDGFLPKKIWASNNKLYFTSNINDAINPGAGFVFFNGHGTDSLWATYAHNSNYWIPPGFYTLDDIGDLHNLEKLPIVITDHCWPCRYELRDDCFGWKFMANPNGGCIAFCGATSYDMSYEGTLTITKGIEKFCIDIAKAYVNGGKTFGEIFTTGLNSYINPTMDEIDYITVEELQPFGDPSLLIAAQSFPPEKPHTPFGPTTGKPNREYTYYSFTSDPDGDRIYYLFDWGDGHFSDWLGPYDGNETVMSNHTWETKGSYLIRVKARDEHGMMSNWSDSLTVSMPKNKVFPEFKIDQLLKKLIQIFSLLDSYF